MRLHQSIIKFPEIKLQTCDAHKLLGYFENVFKEHSPLLHNHFEDGKNCFAWFWGNYEQISPKYLDIFRVVLPYLSDIYRITAMIISDYCCTFVKHHFASQKVKFILLSKGAAISTDAVILVMKTTSISLCLNIMPAPGMPSVSGQQDNAVS